MATPATSSAAATSTCTDLQNAGDLQDLQNLQEKGFALCRGVVTEPALADLRQILSTRLAGSVRAEGASSYAARHVFTQAPEVRDWLDATGLGAIAVAALGEGAEPVDATFFDKTPDANWAVPAHQDVVMPLAAAPEATEVFERHGGLYTDAPDELLRRIIALRLHLDACPVENGALWVIPRSHNRRLDGKAIAAFDRTAFVPCPADSGDVLAMSPLLVHRSSPSTSPHHRRVLHVLYRARVAARSPG